MLLCFCPEGREYWFTSQCRGFEDICGASRERPAQDAPVTEPTGSQRPLCECLDGGE